MTAEPHARDRCIWILVALLTLHLIAVAPHLVVEDLVLDYPFHGGDSQDWIANGLALAGFDVRYSGRPPLLPLVLAALVHLSALEWFPVLNQLVAAGSLMMLFLLLRRLHGGRVALASCAVLLVTYSFQSLTLEVMADLLASTLLFAALALAWAADQRPRRYVAAGLAAGLSSLAQPAALLLPPGVAVLVGVFRREHLRHRALWAGAGLFAVFPLGWVGTRRLFLGAWGDTLVSHWSLLRPHFDAVGVYGWMAASFFGLPLLAAVVAGAGLGARSLCRGEAAGRSSCRRGRRELLALTLTHVLAVSVFFVFLYDFEAERFLLYLFLPAGVLLAEALAFLEDHRGPRSRGALLWGVTAALVLSAAVPSALRGADPREIPLWPRPWLVLQADVEQTAEGAVRPLPGTARVVRAGESFWRGTVWARVRRSRPAVPERLGWRSFVADRGALLLHRPETSRRRYRAAGRLGNALRKRVHFLPADYFGAQWSQLHRRSLGEHFGYPAERVEVPGLAETWLLFSDAPEPRPAATCPGPPPAEALATARRLARRIASRRLPVIVVVPDAAGCDSSRLYLPFLLPAGEIFALRRQAPPALGALEEDVRVGDARLRVGKLRGRRAVVVAYREE